MIYQGQPATVNYGESNNSNENPLQQQQEEQIQENEMQKETKDAPKKTKYMYLRHIFKSVLSIKTVTMLGTAIGIAIGAGFKDLITSFISNIIQPIIIKLLVISDVNNIYNLSQYVSPHNNALNISNFLVSLFSFIILCISIYYINNAVNFVNL